jgi:L-ascorbate metabolism protein UlaG (beta-lactamase superfamily)
MTNKYQYGMVQFEWLGHDSFRISIQGKIIYTDPYILDENPYRADLILVTHDHRDHCHVDNIQKLMKPDTVVVAPPNCVTKLSFASQKQLKLIEPEQSITVHNLPIKSVDAYNINKFRSPNVPYHPPNTGYGYIFTVAGVKIYLAGDTDFIPEMKELANEHIDVALIPVGGKYTMDAQEAADAVRIIKPKVVIPMHWGADVIGTQEDAEKFKEIVGDICPVEILI